MSLRISFEGIDLKKLTDVFGSNDTKLLKKLSKGKKGNFQTILKAIIQGKLTRATTESKKHAKKNDIPWKKIKKWYGKCNPIPFWSLLEKERKYSDRYDMKGRCIRTVYRLWFILSVIAWIIIFLTSFIILFIPGLCVISYWKIKEILHGPEKKITYIKSSSIAEVLRAIIEGSKESLEQKLSFGTPMGIKWQEMDAYIHSLDMIDSRTEQLLNYFLTSRPFFSEEDIDDEPYYGYLTHSEVKELVIAFEKYPEMQKDGGKEYEFFKKVVAAQKDLWYQAI